MKRLETTMDPEQIIAWLRQHNQSRSGGGGSSIVYYEGPYLGRRREVSGDLYGTRFDTACGYLYSAAVFGRIHLVQKKVGDGWYQYIAMPNG